MKDGWMRGMAIGAMVGVSTVALASAMNQRTRRQVMKLMTGAAQKISGKAEQLMK